MSHARSLVTFALLSWLCGGAYLFAQPQRYCRIEIVEKDSEWPVPLIELRTTDQVRLVSDNAGVITLDDPDLLDRESWFFVSGHGYEVPADGFGYHGVRLTPRLGETLRIEVTRRNLAQRLGRITGRGLEVERPPPEPRDARRDSPAERIVGCDSVQNAVHRGKLFWIWGDTTLSHYPLGLFHASAATTSLMPLRSGPPPLELTLNYITDPQGQPRNVARMPGEGPTWLTALVSLRDEQGDERLVATYMKTRGSLEPYQWGLCVWDDTQQHFQQHTILWSQAEDTPQPPPRPDGHAILWEDAAGKRWVLFGNPLPTLRCPARFEAWQDPTTWEPLRPQETLQDASSGTAIRPHSGSVAWHPWRKRWGTVFLQAFGKPSPFGEVWYAEAEAPTGPWGPAVKILTHDNYSFYNPRIHAEFSRADAPQLYFEGTYSAQFADHAIPTPRYDYNQILYQLDLDDPALNKALEARGKPNSGAREADTP